MIDYEPWEVPGFFETREHQEERLRNTVFCDCCLVPMTMLHDGRMKCQHCGTIIDVNEKKEKNSMKLKLIECPRENRETVWMIQTESASGVKEYVYLFMNHLAYAKEDDKLAMSHAEFTSYIRAVESFHIIKDLLTRAKNNKVPKVILEEEI